ncbi:hypothetical protein [Zoogloea sp. LCSB751]|uniref:hypothetical protein n=1 Tax=Zoogloea sp. LCSB751 TaxID=1965277 RepID=UPI0009A554C7|nr:hypothetical protein [Zoogloea sp. LCSB751]
MRTVASLLLVTVLSGCNTAAERLVYEGIRQENARQQAQPGHDTAPDPAGPDFDAYTKERQRLQKESRP